MASKKIDWAEVAKTLLDAAMLLVFGFPAMVASYIWQAMSAGWAFGELAFSPDSFHARYGGKADTEKLIGSLRDTFKR